MIRAPRWQRALVTAACCYELVALWSDLPTITNVAHRFPVAGRVMQLALAIHFDPPSVSS